VNRLGNVKAMVEQDGLSGVGTRDAEDAETHGPSGRVSGTTTVLWMRFGSWRKVRGIFSTCSPRTAQWFSLRRRRGSTI
jgi:hypothetical protein